MALALNILQKVDMPLKRNQTKNPKKSPDLLPKKKNYFSHVSLSDDRKNTLIHIFSFTSLKEFYLIKAESHEKSDLISIIGFTLQYFLNVRQWPRGAKKF